MSKYISVPFLNISFKFHSDISKVSDGIFQYYVHRRYLRRKIIFCFNYSSGIKQFNWTSMYRDFQMEFIIC